MGWTDSWSINLGWKPTNTEAKQLALKQIDIHVGSHGPLKILCPLGGDNVFVHHAWSKGHNVTATDLVPAAASTLRAQFSEGEWRREETEEFVRWNHSSGRVVLYEGKVMQKISELDGKFDAVFIKDSFGSLPVKMRSAFCKRQAECLKPGGIAYVEVLTVSRSRWRAPAFHRERASLMATRNFDSYFEYVRDLGEVREQIGRAHV